MRLLGMLHEGKQDYEKAMDIYIELLQTNPSDSQTVKRLCSLYRDKEMMGECIALLNKYLEVN